MDSFAMVTAVDQEFSAPDQGGEVVRMAFQDAAQQLIRPIDLSLSTETAGDGGLQIGVARTGAQGLLEPVQRQLEVASGVGPLGRRHWRLRR
jgi:hypothetical protein